MRLPAKRRSFPSHRSGKPAARRRSGKASHSGYVLLLVMMMAAILLISLTAALPSIYTEAKREKEQELIFRGTQYARAVYLFHQQFHRYPTSVKELLHTNDMSFLRHPYRDPMTRSGEWRFIHATANGIIIDSEDITVANPLQPGQSSSPGRTSEGAAGSSFGSSQGQGQQQAQNSQENSNPFAMGQQPGGGLPASSNPFAQGQAVGAYIVGVASSSHAASIKVYNRHTHYNKWEFLGIPGVPGSVVQLPVVVPGLNPQPQSGPSNPVSPAPNAPASNSPSGSPVTP